MTESVIFLQVLRQGKPLRFFTHFIVSPTFRVWFQEQRSIVLRRLYGIFRHVCKYTESQVRATLSAVDTY
jgi:hypothetical protein